MKTEVLKSAEGNEQKQKKNVPPPQISNLQNPGMPTSQYKKKNNPKIKLQAWQKLTTTLSFLYL